MRKIIHIDMDAFFASMEQRDNSAYMGKPLAVGYAGPRGVVAAASYEARRYGVRSAMSSQMALRKCPHLIFAPARFDVYKQVSSQIMEIFHEYTDLVEPLSLDEAFLDVTHNHKQMASATQIAEEIRRKIYDQTQLTASAGVSFNKFLAKIASDCNKPNGIFVIKPKDAERFVEQLEIERFWLVGRVTAKRMHQIGVKTGMDLKRYTEDQLVALFGKAGHVFYLNARGIDYREVDNFRIRKSIGAEITFEDDKDSFDKLCVELADVAREVIARISRKEFKGRTVTLKIKYADFKNISRSKTLAEAVTDYQTLYQTGVELLQNVNLEPKVRLIGLSIKNSDDVEVWKEAVQLRINFEEHDNTNLPD